MNTPKYMSFGKCIIGKHNIFAIVLFAFLMLSCKRHKETSNILSEFTFAGYEFEVVEYKKINKKTGSTIEYRIDTILVDLDCDFCKKICIESDKEPLYKR